MAAERMAQSEEGKEADGSQLPALSFEMNKEIWI